MNLPPSYEHVKFEYYPAPKATSALDLLSWTVDIDQGSYLVLDDKSVFVDCTECANILAKFLNEAISIVK